MPAETRADVLNARFSRESKLQAAFMRELRDMGFDLRYHTIESMFSDPGFLDITAIHSRAGLLWTAELKGPRGQTKPTQDAWIEGWRQVRRIACEGYVYPADFDRTLAHLRRLITGR